MKTTPLAALALLLTTFFIPPASAQEATFSLELNNVKPVESACRLTYVAQNGTGTDLTAASFEVAVFDGDGAVDRLLILEFGALQDGKTKVVQFDIANQECENISRLLVNGVAECKAAGDEMPDCLSALATSTRTDIGFGL